MCLIIYFILENAKNILFTKMGKNLGESAVT